MENDIRLIAFDLDGTFLDDQKNIPEENLASLYEAAEAGIRIVPATGRIVRGVPEAIRKLPFVRYYITANGSYVYDAETDSAVARAEIPLARAVEFYRYADTLGVLYDCYRDNWGYMTDWMLARATEAIPDPGIRRLITTLRTPVPELKQYLLDTGTDVQKLQLYFDDPAQRLRELTELPRRFPDLSISSSVPFNIEINAHTATKGHALLALCAHLGLSPSQSMALGDGTNDSDMLEKAGIGVAMQNADPKLKAVADVVTDTNNQAGFAKAVRKYALRL